MTGKTDLNSDVNPLGAIKPIERKPRLSQEVAQHIQAMIQERVLKPGDQLPKERDLAERLGIGRGSLREGLTILEAMGFIEVRAREGSFVKAKPPNTAREAIDILIEEEPDKLFELGEVRKWIDGQGAAIGAQRATPEDIDALWEVYHQMEKVYGKGKYFSPEYDWLYSRFFKILAQSTHNTIFSELMRSFGKMLIGTRGYIRELFSRQPNYAKDLLRQHRKIVAAIEEHDPAKARRLMIQHIDFVHRKVQELMEEKRSP